MKLWVSGRERERERDSEDDEGGLNEDIIGRGE